MRTGYFLQKAPTDSCFKEIEKQYIAFNSPQTNTVSNINGTKFSVLHMWAEEWTDLKACMIIVVTLKPLCSGA